MSNVLTRRLLERLDQSPVRISDLPLGDVHRDIELVELYRLEDEGLVESEMMKVSDGWIREFRKVP